jgi:hypothetical protein
MITILVLISLLLHLIIPLWMWVYYNNRIDSLDVRIEQLETRPLVKQPPKYSPRWRETAGERNRRVLNATRA